MKDYEVPGVGHTGITVSDLHRSLDFYRNVLGFAASDPVRVTGRSVEIITGVQGAELDVSFVRAGGHVLELLCFTRPEQRASSRLRACDAGFTHVCFKVRNLDRLLQAVRKAGFEAVGEVQTITGGPAAGMRVVYTRDPDGVVLEFIEEPAGLVFEELFLARTGS